MFGGLLASAIGKIDGIRGYHAWRWVFILEGLATVVIGIIEFAFVPDFPEAVSWLTEEERSFVIARTGTDKHPDEPVTFRYVLTFVAEPKSLAAGLMYLGGS